MTHGLTAWMQAWSQLAAVDHGCIRLSWDTAQNSIRRGKSELVIPDIVQRELVRVMAAMAWAVAKG
jgi:hypothetical protein